MRRADRVGEVHNFLTILSYDKGQGKFLCLCVCGKEKSISASNVLTGGVKSCGCEKGFSRRKSTEHTVLQYLFNIYRRNARYRKLEFNLTKEQTDELFQLPCVYCGLEYSMETERRWGSGKFKHNGIDRVDSSRDYDYDNCVPCCKLCNQFKHGRTKEEFFNWVEEVMSYQESRKTV